ncbi:putative rotamase [Rickenella mellea]|uniref:Peptidyl-prolyl cis-trans isomerase n=1 Tax=Rickenella mellea TaxID=50990 RepID=A0A4Y7PUS4_9AGAM|nr:putative rotamase [Rickenella mellea]
MSTSVAMMMTLQYLNLTQKEKEGSKGGKPWNSLAENKHGEIRPSGSKGMLSRTPSLAEGSKSSVKGRSKLVTAVKVRHILCRDREKALEAMQKIKDGEPFEEVRHGYSSDRSRAGGCLGWISKGMMADAFASAAFALEPSTLENPILAPLIVTTFGYHVIFVEDRR